MKTNLRMLVAAFVASAGALGVQAQTNLMEGWDGNGMDTTTDVPSDFGWACTSNPTWSEATGDYYLYRYRDNLGVGRVLTHPDNNSVFSFPVELEAGEVYSFSATCSNMNANYVSTTFGLNSKADATGTMFGSQTQTVAQWTGSTSFSFTTTVCPETNDTYYMVWQTSNAHDRNMAWNFVVNKAVYSKDKLQSLITEATSLYGDGTGTGASDLNTAITAANTVNDNASVNAATIMNAEKDLQAAINVYKLSSTGDATGYIVNPSFETGSLTPWVASVSGDTGVKQNSGGYIINNADGNYVFNTWNSGTNNYSVKQTLTGLPEGYYTVTALAATDAGNTVSIYAGSASVDVNPTAKETGTDGTTARVHVTDGTLEIGATSSAWFKVDNFRLNYYTTPDLSELANRWKEAHDAAVAAQSNTDYADVNGVAKATLDTEVAKAEPTTADAYEAAITALNDATEAFIAAEKDYKALKAEITTASGLDTDVDAANALLTSTTATAAEVAEGVNTLKVAEYNKVNDTYTANVTDTYIGTWTSDMVTNTGGQHWDGTNTAYYEQLGSDWNASSWTRAMSQSLTLPAGKYMLKVAGRSSTDATASMTVNGTTVNFPNKGDTGHGITLAGATSFSADDSYANSNNGRGWEWRYIPFELSEDGTASISLGGTTSATHQWMSITSITLLTIPETITLDEDVNYTAEAKAAANVTLKRTLTANKYATFCIPFNMTAEQIAATFGEGTEVSELTSITETDINFDPVETITANKPCILLPKTTASSFNIEGVSIVEPTNNLTETIGTTSMIGSYAAVKYLPTGAYYLKNNNFYTAPDETVSIAGFRAYLVSGGGAKPKNIVINGNNVTGIDGINADENTISGDIYTLGGQLVRKNATTTDGLAKGIYIVNGKKVVVK